MSGDPATASAVFDWQDGAKRLAGMAGPARAACYAVVDAVHVELGKRLGRTFTVADLATVHRGAGDWFPQIAGRAAPRHPEAHDPAITLDGACALYMRRASDAALW